MKSMNIKALTEGAIFAALTAILGIMMIYVPFLQVLVYVWPTPLVIVSYRNGLRVGAIAAFVAAIVISVFSTPISGFVLVLMLGVPGLAMGYCLNKKIKPHISIFITAGVISIALTLSIIASVFMLAPSVVGNINEFDESINEYLVKVEDIYRTMGIEEEKLQLTLGTMRDLVKRIKLILPYIIITSGIIFAYINFKFTRLILSRTGHNIGDIKRFSMWRIPKRLSMSVIMIMLVIVMLKLLRIEFALVITQNIYFLISFMFLMLGLSLVAYYIDLIASKYDIPKPMKVAGILIAFLLLSPMLVAIGMLDTVIDIRGLGNRFGEV